MSVHSHTHVWVGNPFLNLSSIYPQEIQCSQPEFSRHFILTCEATTSSLNLNSHWWMVSGSSLHPLCQAEYSIPHRHVMNAEGTNIAGHTRASSLNPLTAAQSKHQDATWHPDEFSLQAVLMELLLVVSLLFSAVASRGRGTRFGIF